MFFGAMLASLQGYLLARYLSVVSAGYVSFRDLELDALKECVLIASGFSIKVTDERGDQI